MLETTAAKRNKKIIPWIVTLVIVIILAALPGSETFSLQIRLYLIITVVAVLVFAFNLMNQTAAALLLPAAYVLTGLADLNTAFGAWCNPVVWQMVGGLILGNVLLRTGLLRRLAFNCIALTGGTYKGIIYGFGILGVIAVIFMGSATIPVVIFAYGICKTLNLKPSREAAGILMAAGISTLYPLCFIFNGAYFIPAGVGAAAVGEMVSISWLTFLTSNLPHIIGYVLVLFAITRLMKPESPWTLSKDYFKAEAKKLGRITRDEWFCIVVCIAILVFMVTAEYHGIDAMWGISLIPLALFIPGISVGREEDIAKINWSVPVFAVACIAIGNVASLLGIGSIVATAVLPLVSGLSPVLFLLVVAIFMFLLNFLMTPISMYTTFAAPLATMAVGMGINLQPLYLTMIFGGDAILLPYEYALYFFFFSFGLISMKNWVKVAGVKLLISFIVFICLVLPYWNLIGFLNPA